jgi:DNA-binding response OmpR family regulator
MPAKKTTILAADDDPQILRLVTRNLQFDGYEVIAVSDGQAALDHLEAQMPALVVLDVRMPHVDGFQVIQRVRAFSSVPILLLTSLGEDTDKIRGLDLGADDYLTKPFSVEELLARVRAVIRRSQFAADPHGLSATTTVGELTIDYAQHLVTKRGQALSLTPTEYRLLAYLAQNAGRVLPYDSLLEQVWGIDYLGESHMVQVVINRLRQKIEDEHTHPHYLLTKSGVGYVLADPPIGQG